MFKKLKLLFILLTSLLFLGGSYFIIATILEFPLEGFTAIKEGGKIRQRHLAILEEDSEVIERELKNFLLFSANEVSGINFIQQKIDTNYIVREKQGELYIKRDFDLPPILVNDCNKLYCYQHRLKLGEIPSFFWKALINIEDRRFLEHKGIDFKGIFRAVVVDILHMKMVQGASTLTQQLIKNIFLTSEKKISRKIKEMLWAVYLETRYSKEDIITFYFNEIFWGSFQGIQIKGIYAASLFYFAKPIQQLDPFEATILISLLKGPGYYGPIRHLDRLKKRVSAIHQKLISLGLLEDRSFQWSNKQWQKWHKELVIRQHGQDLRELVRIAKDREDFFSDYDKYVFAQAAHKVEVYANDKIKDVTDEKISIMATVYSLGSTKQTFYYYSKWGVNPEKAISRYAHQVGSTLKPIIYSLLVKQGMSFDDKVLTKPIILNLKSGRWKPHEGSRVYKKEVTIREALQRSLNNPLIRLVQEHGFDTIEGDLKRYIPKLQTPLREFPAQLLGAIELTLNELLDAYYFFLLDQ